jgi:hypothetical protein
MVAMGLGRRCRFHKWEENHLWCQERGNEELETSGSESERPNSTEEAGELEPNGSQWREDGRQEWGLRRER